MNLLFIIYHYIVFNVPFDCELNCMLSLNYSIIVLFSDRDLNYFIILKIVLQGGPYVQCTGNNYYQRSSLSRGS